MKSAERLFSTDELATLMKTSNGLSRESEDPLFDGYKPYRLSKAEGIKDPAFLNKVNEFQSWLDEKSIISKTVSIVDILKEMNQTLEGGDPSKYQLAANKDLLSQQLFLYTMNLPQGMDINNRVTIENDAIRLTAMTTEHDSEKFLAFIDKMEAKAKSMGLNLWVTGKGPLTLYLNPFLHYFDHHLVPCLFLLC